MCLFEKEKQSPFYQGGRHEQYCMAFRHRDPRRGRLIETVKIFQEEEEAFKKREQVKGCAPRPKLPCSCARALSWWSHRQTISVPFAPMFVDG